MPQNRITSRLNRDTSRINTQLQLGAGERSAPPPAEFVKLNGPELQNAAGEVLASGLLTQLKLGVNEDGDAREPTGDICRTPH
jgi:hypothetical protein